MPEIAKNLPGLFRGMLCILLHLCFGTVYAWSFFQVLLVDFVGWSYADTSLSFGITIFTLGISAAWAGIMLPKIGPRKLALAGSTLFSLGYVIAAWALHSENLFLFWFGYGFIGGTGLGFGYVVPVATIANWFPGSKGLSTGLVVMGFGLGAMFLSVILAPILLTVTKQDLTSTFLYLGVFFACVLIPSSFFVTNPKSTTAAAAQHVASIEEQQDQYVRRCLQSREFIVMWLIFFFNIAAGISVISFQSPLLQDVWQLNDANIDPERLAKYGAYLIAASSVCNGVGRLLWGLLSDRLGRVMVFRILLASQTVVFGILMTERDPLIFSILVCYVMLCFGGGFAVMPPFVLDVFGSKKMSAIYGIILTAWSCAGVLGPLYVGYLKDNYPNKTVIYCFLIGIAFLCMGFIFSMLLNNERIRLNVPTMASTLRRFNIPPPRVRAN